MAIRRWIPIPGLDLEGFKLEADTIRVLPNPKPPMIADLLRRGTSSVIEIADGLTLCRPNASQHLRVMNDRGIVGAHRDGRGVRHPFRSPVLSESGQLVRRARLAETRFPRGSLGQGEGPTTPSNPHRLREFWRVRIPVAVTGRITKEEEDERRRVEESEGGQGS